LTSATSNSNRNTASGLNDSNLTNNVILTGGADDNANAYEAAGVVWTTSQSISKVTFINGPFNSSTYDGVFDKNFALQTTTNGTTWTAVSGWSLSPAYQYNLPAAAGVTYTFTGSALSVRGFRVVGEVHSLSGNDSWYADATEVQAFATVTSMMQSAAISIGTGSAAAPSASRTIGNGAVDSLPQPTSMKPLKIQHAQRLTHHASRTGVHHGVAQPVRQLSRQPKNQWEIRYRPN
jgi:hypothetical protein